MGTTRAGEGAHLAARELARIEVARWMDVEPSAVTIVAVCRRCGGPHGRPVAVVDGRDDPPTLSISRRSTLLVVAISDAGPIGVDAEAAGAARFDGFDDVALHPADSARSDEDRTRLWVRKESLLKAVGVGLEVDPRLVHLSPADEEPRLIRWDAVDEPELPAQMFDLELADQVTACVTVLAIDRPRLTVTQAA